MVPASPPAVYAPPAYTPPAYASPSYATPAPSSSPYTASPYSTAAAGPVPDVSVHPVLALLLGFIPGVGAIYNGQYAKGLVHAVVFALLVSAESSGRSDGMEAFIGIMIAASFARTAASRWRSPRITRKSVLLPEPFGPVKAQCAPGSRSQVMPVNAR